jgi:AcrR family transcriptional regulator
MARSRTPSAKVATARTARARHRPHLIDACISALHLYGPSKTTVDKVVAIAGLSPGIVRFYFDSKDAMLVASLEFLAHEFEQRLIQPVSARMDDPVAAMDLLVDLYLGPELASTRKVSVWYAFWGEASSRQEYYDICGARDTKFESLVYEITHRLLAREPSSPAEPDAIALGLIGTLEVLWQGFAFQTESAIDRGAARRRVDSYLRSVFPQAYGRGRATAPPPGDTGWQFAGLVADFREPGDSTVVDTPVVRLLVVRGPDLALRTFVNRCPHSPHALLESPRGRRISDLTCRRHGVAFDLIGRSLTDGVARLDERACACTGRIVWASTTTAAAPPSMRLADALASMPLQPMRVDSVEVPASAAVVTELLRDRGAAQAQPVKPSWSDQRMAGVAPEQASIREWMEPNQLLEMGPAGLTVTKVLPAHDGHSTLVQWRYDRPDDARRVRALRYLMVRQRRTLCALAVSTQRGLDAEARAQGRPLRLP